MSPRVLWSGKVAVSDCVGAQYMLGEPIALIFFDEANAETEPNNHLQLN